MTEMEETAGEITKLPPTRHTSTGEGEADQEEVPLVPADTPRDVT